MHFTPSGTEASTKTSFFGLTDAVTFSPPGRIPLLASPPALAIRLQTAPQRAMPRATCIRMVDGFSASFYNAAFEEATRRVAVSQRTPEDTTIPLSRHGYYLLKVKILCRLEGILLAQFFAKWRFGVQALACAE